MLPHLSVVVYYLRFDFVTLQVIMHFEFRINQLIFNRFKLNDFLGDLDELLYYHILIHLFCHYLILESIELGSLFDFRLIQNCVGRDFIINPCVVGFVNLHFQDGHYVLLYYHGLDHVFDFDYQLIVLFGLLNFENYYFIFRYFMSFTHEILQIYLKFKLDCFTKFTNLHFQDDHYVLLHYHELNHVFIPLDYFMVYVIHFTYD